MTDLVKSLWVGQGLSPFEVLSIRSFLDNNIEYQLFTYDEFELPAGCVRREAESIIPRSEVSYVSSNVGRGSVAPFADLFRYELLCREGGWWADTDVVCLTETLPTHDCFFAWESPSLVNCAVMKFPPKHRVMLACRDHASLNRSTGQPWGSTGPVLLTKVLRDHKLIGKAFPTAKCYPIDWTQTLALFDPGQLSYMQKKTSRAFGIHLWNEILRRNRLDKFVAPPAGSYLDQLFVKHAIEFPSDARHKFSDILRGDEQRRLRESEATP